MLCKSILVVVVGSVQLHLFGDVLCFFFFLINAPKLVRCIFFWSGVMLFFVLRGQ